MRAQGVGERFRRLKTLELNELTQP